jgi:hypothetical protein
MDLVEKIAMVIYSEEPVGVREWQDAPVATAETSRAIARSVLSCIEETHELVPYPHVPTPEEVKKAIEDTTGIPDILRG